MRVETNSDRSTKQLRNVSAVALLVATALSTQAAVRVNDTFADGTRDDPASTVYSENGVDLDNDGSLESAWYSSTSSGASVTPGAYRQALAGPTSSSSWTTYFTPESTPITLGSSGDFVKVTWRFTPNTIGGANTSQNFRLAVADSPGAGSRLTGDTGSPPGSTAYSGYAMFMNMAASLGRNTPFELHERSSSGNFLSGSTEWSTILGDDGSTGDAGYTSGTSYTYTMTLTRNASSGLDIVSRMEGTGLGPNGQGFLQVSVTDATPNTFTFDTFGVRGTGSDTTALSFDNTLFRVDTNLAVPEPATFTAIAAAAVGLAGRRRR